MLKLESVIQKNSIQRILNLPNLLNKKSFFLFGCRGTGKTTLIRNTLSELPRYDLLSASTFASLSRRPSLIGEENKNPHVAVVIDEIQKLPQLLDEVHRLIEERGMRFILTGSSARKLKRGGANLLAGRAWEARLFPLVSDELGEFDLLRYLTQGGLPAVWTSNDPWEELRAYVGTYLKEEIMSEALVRRIDTFSAFLELAALRCTEEINFEAFGSDLGVSGKTARNFFEVLEDTLIGFLLRPYKKTKLRKATSRAKFYLFDLGVTNSLAGRREIPLGTETFGKAFEHFIILELRAYLSYRRLDLELGFWRTEGGFEVDLTIGSQVAIEIKGSDLVTERHLSGLRALREEKIFSSLIVVSRDNRMRELDGFLIYPWREFLIKLWNDEILTINS
jgi:predicted AAA+ superfamily ATPase